MRVYRLKITPERAPGVFRTVECSERHTLHDVHCAIQQVFELDDDHLYAFYTSGKHWDLASEVSGPGPSGPGRAGAIRLGRMLLRAGVTLSYVFDFGDELWHSIRVESVRESRSPPARPALVETVGEAPPQYPWDEDEQEEGDVEDAALDFPRLSEAAAFASEFAEEFEALVRTKPSDTQGLLRVHALAAQIADSLEGDAERLYLLEAVVGVDLLEDLLALPLALASAGYVDEGAELCRTLSLVDEASLLPDRAIILAHAGRREEALAQVGEMLEADYRDVWVEINAANVYETLGDAERALVLYRAALEHAPTLDEREDLLDRLIPLLREQGCDDEADELEASERQRVDRESLSLHAQDAVRREGTKVGRNDPCPCGSGKKHKKCCGA